MSQNKCAAKRPHDRIEAKKSQTRHNILLKVDVETKESVNCKKNVNKSLKNNEVNGGYFEVEKITGLKLQQGRTLYKVRWKGYNEADDSWEPEDNLINVKDMIDEFLTTKVGDGDDNERSNICPKTRLVGGYEYVPSDELVARKTKFFDDVRDGKIDLTKNDLYSRVKTRCRLKSEANDIIAEDGNPVSNDVCTCSPCTTITSSCVKNKYYQSNLFEITAEFMKNNNFEKCLTSMNDDISSLNCSISPITEHSDDLQLSPVQSCPWKYVATQTESTQLYDEMVELKESESIAKEYSEKAEPEMNDNCCIHDHDDISMTIETQLWNMYANEIRSSDGGAVVLPAVHRESKIIRTISFEDLRDIILSNKHSLLNHALKSGVTFDLERLMSPENVTPLQFAVSKKRCHIVRLLLRYGVCSAECVWNAVLTASEGGHVHVLKALLDHSAPTDRHDLKGKNALYVAIEHGRVDVVRLLLQHGANFLEVAPRLSATCLVGDLLMSHRFRRSLCMDLFKLVECYQHAFLDSLNRTVDRYQKRQACRQSCVIFPHQWISVLEHRFDMQFTLYDNLSVHLGTPVLLLVHGLQTDCSFDFWLDNGCCCIDSVFVNDVRQSSLSNEHFVSTLWPLNPSTNSISVRFKEPGLLSREDKQVRIAIVALGITTMNNGGLSHSRQYN